MENVKPHAEFEPKRRTGDQRHIGLVSLTLIWMPGDARFSAVVVQASASSSAHFCIKVQNTCNVNSSPY